jgi:predicted TIM-barrel fold metal-dependent hydrolase
MEQAAEVFSQVPNLQVTICHCGSPWYRDDEGWRMWRKGLISLASLPNIHCKISGLSMFDHNWSVETLRPVIETVISIFGSERCMFGSNFPVDKLHTNYQRLWQAYLEITRSISPALSEHQIRGLFKENCATFYRI